MHFTLFIILLKTKKREWKPGWPSTSGNASDLKTVSPGSSPIPGKNLIGYNLSPHQFTHRDTNVRSRRTKKNFEYDLID